MLRGFHYAAFAAFLLLGTTANAQNTFEVVTQGAVANVPGLHAMTVRDNSLSVCYTVFTFDGPSVFATRSTSGSSSSDSVERVRQLAEQRDKDLSLLEARLAEGERTQSAYETERFQLDLEYQRSLRHEIPESTPWASALPGMRSGGFEDPANANRRASVDPDTTSVMKTLLSQFSAEMDLLRLLVEAPRVTSSGPFECPATEP